MGKAALRSLSLGHSICEIDPAIPKVRHPLSHESCSALYAKRRIPAEKMTSASLKEPELPSALQKLSQNPRVTVRRSGVPSKDGKCVVYWMQRAERALDNPALDVAIQIGERTRPSRPGLFFGDLQLPQRQSPSLLLPQSGTSRHRSTDLAERRYSPSSFVRPPDNSLEALLSRGGGAAMVIGDENPCREPERWRSVLAKRLQNSLLDRRCRCRCSRQISSTSTFYALQFFRPKLYAHFPEYLVPSSVLKPTHEWKRPKSFASFDVNEDVTQGWKDLDRSVNPVDYWTGGTHAAMKRLKHFVDHGLANYPETRNHPEADGTSQMSPYLHFRTYQPTHDYSRSAEGGEGEEGDANGV